MFISPDNKFVFIHTPKCAGSSTHVALKDMYAVQNRLDPFPLEHHMTWSNFLKSRSNLREDYVKDVNDPMTPPITQQNPDPNNIFGFSFVRNPWDRVVSAYFDPALPTLAETFQQFVTVTLPDILQSPPTHESIHYFPAVYFTLSSERELDFIGKHENLQEDMSRLSDILGIDMSLGHHRRSSRPTNRHKDLYDSITKEVVQTLYFEDIERFEYEF
tara:strand:- start:546 stop:1193 length:648 start_codon:yes stop_codon:yes gene_type:complete